MLHAIVSGSRPKSSSFKTNRVIDPLEPAYKLPTSKEITYSPPPYKRDLHANTDDIPGSKPNAYLHWKTRDTNVVSDIEGTAPKSRVLPPREDRDTLNVVDINNDGVFKSTRRVDPLRPAFVIHGRVVADDDPDMFSKSNMGAIGAHAKQLRKDTLLQEGFEEVANATLRALPSRPMYSLLTDDIPGAQANNDLEAKVSGIPPYRRRHFRVTNHIADIKGSAAGSFRRGVRTIRGTDPNERDYVLLDGRHLEPDEMTVGKSWFNAATTIIAAEAADNALSLPFGRTNVSRSVPPTMRYATKVLDPREAENAHLRGTVEALKKENEIYRLSSQVANSDASLGDTAAMSSNPAASGYHSYPEYEATSLPNAGANEQPTVRRGFVRDTDMNGVALAQTRSEIMKHNLRNTLRESSLGNTGSTLNNMSKDAYNNFSVTHHDVPSHDTILYSDPNYEPMDEALMYTLGEAKRIPIVPGAGKESEYRLFTKRNNENSPDGGTYRHSEFRNVTTHNIFEPTHRSQPADFATETHYAENTFKATGDLFTSYMHPTRETNMANVLKNTYTRAATIMPPTVIDPITTLRKGGVSSDSRDVLGILPATRPPQNIQSTSRGTVHMGLSDTGPSARDITTNATLAASKLRAGDVNTRLTRTARSALPGTHSLRTAGNHLAKSQSFGGSNAAIAPRQSYDTRIRETARFSDISEVRNLPT